MQTRVTLGWLSLCVLAVIGLNATAADPVPARSIFGPRPVGFPSSPSREAASPGKPAGKTEPILPVRAVPPLAIPPAESSPKPLIVELPQGFDLAQYAVQPPGPPGELPKLPSAPQPLPLVRPTDPPAEERRLNALAAPVGATPQPNAETRARYQKYLEQIVDPDNTLDLVLNRDRLLRFKDAPKRVQLGDTGIANLTIIAPKEVTLTGKRIGTTVLTLWFTDPKDATKQEVLSYLVRVLPDPEYKERLERVYEALAGEINKAFPDSVVKLQLVGDKLVLSGTAKDISDAYQIVRVVRANAPRGTSPENLPVGQVNLNVSADAVAAAATDPEGEGAGLQNYLVAGGPNVINLMRVGGEHQVMLKVCVAEVNRAGARSVGVNFDVARTDGLVVFANLTGNLGVRGAIAAGSASGNVGLNNLPILLGGGQVAAAVNALKSLNLARSLAEPNLVTMNGRPASFQAGGQFPVPVVTGFTSGGLQGVTFVPFGVSLNFTPTITDGDRIRLAVNAEVSTRDLATAQTNIGGANVPSLSSRNFQTTVELRAGETLAVAGLMQNNMSSDATRVPFVGEVPVLGRLFAFDRTSTSDQELVVLITPYLVHAFNKNEPKPPLPGADLAPPTDCDFYLLGRLQNYGNDPVLRKRALACEQNLLVGPVGYAPIK